MQWVNHILLVVSVMSSFMPVKAAQLYEQETGALFDRILERVERDQILTQSSWDYAVKGLVTNEDFKEEIAVDSIVLLHIAQGKVTECCACEVKMDIAYYRLALGFLETAFRYMHEALQEHGGCEQDVSKIGADELQKRIDARNQEEAPSRAERNQLKLQIIKERLSKPSNSILVRCPKRDADILFFFRFIQELAKLGMQKVIVALPDSIKKLIHRALENQNTISLVSDAFPRPPRDYDVHLLELPYYVSCSGWGPVKNYADLPQMPSCLKADEQLKNIYCAQIKRLGKRPIALAPTWIPHMLESNSVVDGRIDYATLLHLSRIKNAEIFLMPDASSGTDNKTYEDAAALCEAVKEHDGWVIGGDNEIAMMAGIVGAKTMMLLTYACDPRWGANDCSGHVKQNNWFATMMQCQQSKEDEWDAVINNVVNYIDEH
jgi:hypothetical protein